MNSNDNNVPSSEDSEEKGEWEEDSELSLRLLGSQKS